MQELFFTTVIFSSCFLFLSIGILLRGQSISGSCGRRKGDPLIVDGREVEIDCLCESTGQENACDGISENDLVDAMLKAKAQVDEDLPDLSEKVPLKE